MNKRKNNNSPLKIAVLGHKTIPSRQGGIEIVVEELTVRMAKLGHKITVYAETASTILNVEKECQVFWVGLSAKKKKSNKEIPLSPETNTGMVIQRIEEVCGEVTTYKTNLVKCLPLTEEQKLRYPNKKEIDSCYEHLAEEIQELSPKIVFLLGGKVSSAVEKHLKINFEKWDEFKYCLQVIRLTWVY